MLKCNMCSIDTTCLTASRSASPRHGAAIPAAPATAPICLWTHPSAKHRSTHLAADSDFRPASPPPYVPHTAATTSRRQVERSWGPSRRSRRQKKRGNRLPGVCRLEMASDGAAVSGESGEGPSTLTPCPAAPAPIPAPAPAPTSSAITPTSLPLPRNTGHEKYKG